MKKKSALLLLLPLLAITKAYSFEPTAKQPVRPFGQLEIGVNASTLGIGIDFATPINDYLSLRGGYTFMPKFSISMEFGVGIEERMYQYDEAGNIMLDEYEEPMLTDFGRIIDYVESFTGSKTQNKMTMIAEPTMHNYKLLVDVHPFQDKRWRFTTGFFAGSSTIARVSNSAGDIATLYTANMFNRIYEKAEADEPFASVGGFDLYAGPALLDYGRIGLDVGEREDGSIYRMEPNELCIVSVEAKTNVFKPYLGFGYKGGTGKTHLNVDCGVLFWGGAPDLITHDGTNLTRDLTKIEGQMGQYVDLARRFTVFPMLSIGISREL